tara:strand:- start:385 stop:516 length:132 start_codon:yes stop_codon:yes gene_type:complete
MRIDDRKSFEGNKQQKGRNEEKGRMGGEDRNVKNGKVLRMTLA